MLIFNKIIVPHEKFYIVKFTKNEHAPYLVFLHGGPGLNCGTIEYLIEKEEFFSSLDCNIVLYDQRGCGRSSEAFKDSKDVSHADNISDLGHIYEHLKSMNLIIGGIIGHSYGAKLLFDFLKKSQINLPAIFVSTADSIYTPRLNNLLLDLAYLKKIDPIKYQKIIVKMNSIDRKSIWNLTEELAPLFQENKDRPLLYWANVTIFEKIKKIQDEIYLPINSQIFQSVRKSLYSSEAQALVDINSLQSPYIWINGFHDYIMGEPVNGLSKKSQIILFLKSSHYPHIEENDLFCETLNVFIKKN